jgi:hypothetical protein
MDACGKTAAENEESTTYELEAERMGAELGRTAGQILIVDPGE